VNKPQYLINKDLGVVTPESKKKKIRLDLPPNLFVVMWVVKIVIKKKRFGSSDPKNLNGILIIFVIIKRFGSKC